LLASQNNFAQKSVRKSTKKAASKTGKKTNLKQRIVSAENWKTVSDETGIFTFQMPGKIEKSRSTSQTADGGNIRLFQFRSTSDGQIFMLTYYENLINELNKTEVEMVTYKTALNFVLQDDKIISDKYLSATDSDKSFAGHEIVVESDYYGGDNIRHIRFLYAETNGFLLVTEYPASPDKKTRYETSAKHYFDSLKLEKKAVLLEVQSVKPAAENERNCFEQKDYRCAIEYFSRIIESDPKNIAAFEKRGLSYFYLGSSVGSADYFDGLITGATTQI